MTLEERFLSRFTQTEGCWLWTGYVNAMGYGRLGLGRTKRLLAHRVSYEYFKGPIPDGLTIDHLCRNHRCVNPAHLEAVTQRVNSSRGMAPNWIAHRANICIRGHSLEDAYVHAGRRRCRTCRQQDHARWSAGRSARRKAARAAA